MLQRNKTNNATLYSKWTQMWHNSTMDGLKIIRSKVTWQTLHRSLKHRTSYFARSLLCFSTCWATRKLVSSLPCGGGWRTLGYSYSTHDPGGSTWNTLPSDHAGSRNQKHTNCMLRDANQGLEKLFNVFRFGFVKKIPGIKDDHSHTKWRWKLTTLSGKYIANHWPCCKKGN